MARSELFEAKHKKPSLGKWRLLCKFLTIYKINSLLTGLERAAFDMEYLSNDFLLKDISFLDYSINNIRCYYILNVVKTGLKSKNIGMVST